MTDSVELATVLEKIGQGFEEFKEKNDKRLEEERAGNEARAKELAEQLDKISDELTDNQKKKAALEKKIEMAADRLEILESVNDRPRKTIADKINDEHKELFLRWIRSGGNDYEAEKQYKELAEKSKEVKQVTIGSNAGGGFAVPEEIARQINALYLKLSDVAQNVKNIEVGTSDYKELVSINGAGYAWAAETDTRTEKATPTLRQRTPTMGELYAYPWASNWSLEDTFFNVEDWLTSTVAEQWATGISTAIYSGDGSNKPTGMFNGTPVTTDDYASPMRSAEVIEYIPITSPSSPYTTSGLTADTVIDLVYALNPRYRGNAKFAANTVTQGHLRKLKDSNNQYLWQPSLQAGQPDRLLGYQMFTWEDLGNPTSANAYPLVFGDFQKGYTFVRRAGMRMVRDEVTKPGYTKFYIAQRFGGILTNNDALKTAKVAVS